MKIKKLKDHLVLIRVDKPQDADQDGIFTQEEWKTLPPTGVVEAVADNVANIVGEHVFFERFSAIAVPWDAELRLCREEAILMVLDDAAR